MRYLAVLLLLSTPALAGEAETLCATNPAFSRSIMLSVVVAQLQHDHDPALDAETPDKLADDAVVQGITECATEMHNDPAMSQSLSSLLPADRSVGWDAYNTTCADRKATRGACITAEVASSKALHIMMKTNQPPGAKTLVQTCELVMQGDPAMTEWRSCVDQALAVHATEDAAKRCKLSATWHVAKTGDDAGRIISLCLTAK